MADKDNKVSVKDKTHSPSNLESTLKNKSVWVIGIGVIVIFAAVMLSVPSDKDDESKKPDTFSLSQGEIGEQSWQVKAQARLEKSQENAKAARKNAETANRRTRTTQKLVQKMSSQIEQIQRQLRTDDSQQEAGQAQDEQSGTISSDKNHPEPDQSSDASQGSNDYALPPPPPKPPGARPANQTAAPPVQGARGGAEGNVRGPDAPSGNQPYVFTPPTQHTAANAEEGEHGPSTSTEYEENKYAGYLPTGSFAPVVLLSGLDAAASQQTQANPQPVLMRVQSNATTPGEGAYAMSSCVLIGSAYGDLSAERAYIRLTRISCVQPRSGRVLESDITGYVTDSDGFQGLRGKLVRRNGQLLAKSILAGFASSISDVAESVSQQNARTITTTGSGLGAQQNSVNVSPGQIAKAGAFGGVSNAADSLAQYYLDQAKNIFPVISIPPGRKGTIIITEGTSLKWHSTTGRFIKQVQPNG